MNKEYLKLALNFDTYYEGYIFLVKVCKLVEEFNLTCCEYRKEFCIK